MKTILLNLLMLSTSFYGLFSCRPDPCSVDFLIANSSSVEIQLEPGVRQGYYFVDSSMKIRPDSSLYFGIGRDDPKYDSVPIYFLVFIDSVKVIFDNKYTVMHYRDSTKGDYSHSIFNMKSYEKNYCEFTYTFTQEDFERAKAVK